jgi:hypothetical protein
MNAIHIDLDAQQNAADVWHSTPDLSHSAHLQIHGWQTGVLVPEGCPCVCIYSDYSVKPGFWGDVSAEEAKDWLGTLLSVSSGSRIPYAQRETRSRMEC